MLRFDGAVRGLARMSLAFATPRRSQVPVAATTWAVEGSEVENPSAILGHGRFDELRLAHLQRSLGTNSH